MRIRDWSSDVCSSDLLTCPGKLELRWVHRSAEGATADALVEAVQAATFPSGTPDVFVHGEASEVRAVRRHLLGERGVPKEGVSISPYWRRKFTDEAWREVKKEWLAEVAQEDRKSTRLNSSH